MLLKTRFTQSMDKFKLTDAFLDKYRKIKPSFGFNGLGELVYLRTYSRIKANGDNEKWWETIQRVVEGTFNMQKKWIEQHRLGWSAIKAQKSAQEMYDRIFHMKFLPPGRGLWAMGSSITEERNLYMALNNPLGLNTKILTKEYGWIEIGEIVTDEVTVLTSTKKYSVDHAKNIKSNSKWVKAKVSNIELHPCFEITYQSKFGEKTTIVASENHRWFRKKNTASKWEKITTGELKVGDWLPSIRPPKYFKYSTCGVQHGLFFGDGTRCNGELHQFGDSNIKAMEKLFSNTNIDILTPLPSGESHIVVRHCPLAWGKIPNGNYLNDDKYIIGFLMGYFCADGYIDKNGKCTISSSRINELEDVRELFKKIGIRTTNPILSSIKSNFSEVGELYQIEICKKDLPDYFFIKDNQKIIFEEKQDNQQQDWLQIINIKNIKELQQVRCVTVPKYEQFVIDGFCITSNCSFCSTENIKEDLSKPFCFLMDVSMLGVGCGFDIRGVGKIDIKSPSKTEETYIIPDSREGWVESVKLLLDSYFLGTKTIKFDYSLIRKAGTLIKGFGGLSSGPEPLIETHEVIRKTLDRNVGHPITITTIVDIMNLIGKCVVAGNVRRCLPKGTLIHTFHGLIPIENIVPGMKAKTSSGYEEISELVYQGKQNILSIKTQMGNFYCTSKHKIAKLISPTKYEWVYAENLQESDRVVFVEGGIDGINTSLPSFVYNKGIHSTTCVDISIPELDSDMAWFFGLFHGDGYTYPNYDDNGFNAYISIACSPEYPNVINDCQSQIKRFGVNLCDIPGTINDRSYKVRSQSKQLSWYLSTFKTAKTEINIPEFILQGKINIRCAYLAGLFDSDGSKNNRPVVAATSIYPLYLRQIQALYASVGIPTRFKLRREPNNNWKALYELTIVGQKSKEDFKVLILPYSRTKENFIQNISKRSQNDYSYPSEWIKNSTNENITLSKYISLGNDNKKLVPVMVLSISNDNIEEETYDISVPNAKEFVCQEGLLVHNTAEIVFGDYNSHEYLDLKNYKVNPHRENFGWTSNNSIFCELGMDYTASSDRTKINGEPGYAWLENMKGYSRMNNGMDHKDHRVTGGNPCLEQSLESYEVCNLVETFPFNHDSLEDYLITLKYAYLYAKTVTLGQTHWAETNRVMLRNRRIGCSMSGIAQFVASRGLHELKKWCEEGYRNIEYYDEIYSDWLAIPKSIKKTSIKPSGTVSLLAGATPGVHFPESVFYIRRVRLSKHSDLIIPLKDAGYKIEPCFGSEDSTVVVEIPIKVGDGIRSVNNVSIWEQLALAAFMQRYWADNQVSCTVSFKKEESDQIKHALNIYQYQLKGISFLPIIERGAYKQMPYESITESCYNNIISTIKPVKFKNVKNEEAEVERFCSNDTCQVVPKNNLATTPVVVKPST